MLINGKAIAEQRIEKLKQTISQHKGRPPALAFILVGNHPASMAYVRMKKRRCAEVGILSIDKEMATTTTEAQLLEEIGRLNANPHVDGILVQLPLPSHFHTHTILAAIDPHKDVDGFHPLNMGKLLIGDPTGFVPCTPLGIQVMLQDAQIPIQGKHVVIVGRSTIVGKPLAALLVQKGAGGDATITLAHSRTENLPDICRTADILVAAIGNPHFITAAMVKRGAVVVDVGINRHSMTPSILVGDVDFESVAPIASAITPVPGGVGPMTIAMLLANTWRSFTLALNR